MRSKPCLIVNTEGLGTLLISMVQLKELNLTPGILADEIARREPNLNVLGYETFIQYNKETLEYPKSIIEEQIIGINILMPDKQSHKQDIANTILETLRSILNEQIIKSCKDGNKRQ